MKTLAQVKESAKTSTSESEMTQIALTPEQVQILLVYAQGSGITETAQSAVDHLIRTVR